MNNKVLIGVLLTFVLTISAVGFINAQTYNIPEPVCVPAPGIPCPGQKSIEPLQHPQSLTIPKTSESQTFKDLLQFLNKKITNLADQLVGGFKILFDNAKNFFQKIKI